MADVYLDEDVWLQLADDLRLQGHAVVTYRDHRLRGASDALHLLTAAQEQRVLVTCNRRDFRLLHDAWHYWTAAWGVATQHAGIIVVDQTVPRQAHAVGVLALLAGNRPFQARLYEWRNGAGGAWYEFGQGRWTLLR